MKKLAVSGTALVLLSLLGQGLAGGAGAPPAPATPAAAVSAVQAAVQAATPASVAATLRAAGYGVTMNPAEPDRDPSMTVLAGDYELQVWLSGCQAGVCARVTASTSWSYAEDADALDVELVNDWNGNYYTQAYVYEDSYFLDSTLTIGGGYTRAALGTWMTDYLDDIGEFETELP